MTHTLSLKSEGSSTDDVKTVQHLLKNKSLKVLLQKRLRPLMIPNYTNRYHTRISAHGLQDDIGKEVSPFKGLSRGPQGVTRELESRLNQV